MDFTPARWFTPGPRDIRRIILHDGEVPESKTAAEAIANFFHGGSRKGSAHFECDFDSTVQSVQTQDVAWHAAGDNQETIGIEQAGYAAQTRDQWLDAYGTQMIVFQTAPLVARLALAHNLPIRQLSDSELAANQKGVATHAQVSRVFGKSSHWDPGPNYPIDVLLKHAQEWLRLFVKQANPAQPVILPKIDVLKALQLYIIAIKSSPLGEHNWKGRTQEVLFVQKLLRKAGAVGLALDSAFGPTDRDVTKVFQASRKLPVTGVVDGRTLDALLA